MGCREPGCGCEPKAPSLDTTVKTYLIDTNQGSLQIDIPENWKVTYGPVSPGAKGYGNDLALRIYESDTKQRAIFTGVRSFRDMSIPVRRKITTESGVASWDIDENSSIENKNVSRQSTWVEADEV